MINKLKQQKLEEFDKNFPLGGEIWVLERHKKEVRDYLSNLIDEVDETTTQSLLEELEKSKHNHDEDKCCGNYGCEDCNYHGGFDDGLDKAISIVKKYMGEEMKLSQTRQAIVEEIYGLCEKYHKKQCDPITLNDGITQALKDYTQNIIEMVENHAEEAGWDARAADQLLEELTK